MSPCITPLHLTNCKGTPAEVELIDEVLKKDRRALHRPQYSHSLQFAVPVLCSAEAGHASCLKLILDRGGDINCISREGMGPMFYAVRSGSVDCVELLLARGSHLNHEDKDGNRTPLYVEQACRSGHGDILRLLLQRGAITGMTEVESTPLIIAVTEGFPVCVKWMLLYGADFTEQRLRNDILPHLTTPDTSKCSPEAREEILTIFYDIGIDISYWVILLKKKGADRLAQHIQTLLRRPRTLQSACRVTVRRALGHRNYNRRLRELRVPPYFRSIMESRLKTFLQFNEH
ncbi:hypothetical protein B566_EDAN011538 [Ephemera danica]|nr:hypothetical protein B566_EDAN011538 [Ephemera danica]